MKERVYVRNVSKMGLVEVNDGLWLQELSFDALETPAVSVQNPPQGIMKRGVEKVFLSDEIKSVLRHGYYEREVSPSNKRA